MTEEEQKEYIKILDERRNSPGDIAKKVRKFCPLNLYRYRSFETKYWKDEIFKGKIYLAQATQLNDPMDCLAYFDTTLLSPDCKFIGLIKQKFKCSYNEIINKLRHENNTRWIFENLRSDIRTASFCENNFSLLMWSHYANMHNGFCIKYNTKMLKPIISGMLYPVIYSSEKPDILVEVKDCTWNAGVKALVYKAKEWEYEHEWRVINKADGQYEFFQLDAIEEIYLGARCEEKDKEEVVNWAKENGKEVYQMKIDLKEYRLIIDRII